jgi:ABC-type lipoprotein export system ATPase subunit
VTALDARALCKSVTLPSGRRLELLRGVDLTVGSGQSVSVVGRSGSGKSTLLALLGLLSEADTGMLRVAGQDVAALGDRGRARLRNEHIGFVFQNYSLLAHLTAAENVALPLLQGKSRGTRQVRDRVATAMESVGIAPLAQSRPRQLSGGEQQRVAIARALVGTPALILADEPTGALDTETAGQVLSTLLTSVAGQGAALVLVTHDPEVATRTQRAYRLDHGLIVKEGEDECA